MSKRQARILGNLENGKKGQRFVFDWPTTSHGAVTERKGRR